MARLKKVQKRFTKRLCGHCGFRDLAYPERLNRLGLPSLELRRLHLDLMLCYKIVFGLIHAKSSDFFRCNNSANTRGHAYKLYKSQYTNSARTNSFANRIVNVWNSLPATLSIDFNSLAAFKRTVKRADLSAFLLCNCTSCVLCMAFISLYIIYSCNVRTVLCHITAFMDTMSVQKVLP